MLWLSMLFNNNLIVEKKNNFFIYFRYYGYTILALTTNTNPFCPSLSYTWLKFTCQSGLNFTIYIFWSHNLTTISSVYCSVFSYLYCILFMSTILTTNSIVDSTDTMYPPQFCTSCKFNNISFSKQNCLSCLSGFLSHTRVLEL